MIKLCAFHAFLDVGITYPSEWDEMSDGKIYKLVEVAKDEDEFKVVRHKFFETMSDSFTVYEVR